MKRFRKKGFQKLFSILFVLLVASAIIGFYLYWIGAIGGRGISGTRYYSLAPMLEICRGFGTPLEHDYGDTDDDGLPDFCDNCPEDYNCEADLKCKIIDEQCSDEYPDKDHDCFPDDCDTDKDDPTKFPKYTWDGNTP